MKILNKNLKYLNQFIIQIIIQIIIMAKINKIIGKKLCQNFLKIFDYFFEKITHLFFIF